MSGKIRLLLLTQEIDGAEKKAHLARAQRNGFRIKLVAALPTKIKRPDLTPRQTQVLRGIALGFPTKAIARDLGISIKTVETHRMQLINRLGIKHVPGLVRYALKTGVVPPTWLGD